MATIAPQKKLQSGEIEEVIEVPRGRSSITLPPPPGNRCSWEQAQPYLDELSPQQSECLETYCYRVFPEIVRQLSDPKNANYIDKIPGKINREYFVSMHGGGRYRLDVKNHTTNKPVMIIKLDIPISEAEPKLNLAELDMNARENKAYVSRLMIEGKITQDGKLVNNQPQQSQNGVTDSTVNLFKEIMSVVRTNQPAPRDEGLGSALGTLLLERMKQENPANQVTMLTGLLEAVKTMTPKAETGILEILMKTMTENSRLQSEANKTQMELMMKMIEMRQPQVKEEEEDDGLGKGSSIDKLGRLFEFAKMIKGGGNGIEKSGWEMAIDAGKEILPPLLSTIQGFLAFRANSNQGSFPAQGGFPPPNGPGVPMLPPQALPQGTNMNGNQTGVEPPKVVTMPNPNQPSQLQQMIGQYGGLILQHLSNGTPGAEVAALLVDFVGKPTWNLIARNTNEDLINACKGIPEFWGQILMVGDGKVFGEEYFSKWLDDFRNYEELLKQEETEDEE